MAVAPTISTIKHRLKEALAELSTATNTSEQPPCLERQRLINIAIPSTSRMVVSELPQPAPAPPAPDDLKHCMECAARELLYDVLNEGGNDVFQTLFALFDLILMLVEAELGDQQLPFLTIEEALDVLPIDGCKRVFSYLESRIGRLTVGVDGTKGKGIILLRLCNELLRRLSKSEDTVFCGRIFVFLTKSFPLSERSGVNLRGEFHLENRTTFASALDDLPNLQRHVGGAKAQGSNDTVDAILSTHSPLQAASAFDSANRLYAMLWSTQHDFVEPARLFQKSEFQNFKESLEAVVKAFKLAIDEHGHNLPPTADLRGISKRKHDHNEDYSDLNSYNPKYLTSRELFSLEIHDLIFRRHILVQFLIVIEFLLSLAPKHKKYLEPDAKNRSVQFPYALDEVDEKWAETAKKDIVGALNHKSGMDGLLFSRTVDSVLTREKNWVKWKADNCLSFEVSSVEPPEIEDATKTALDASAQLAQGYFLNSAKSGIANLRTDRILDRLQDGTRVSLPLYKEYGRAIDEHILDKDFAHTEQEKGEIDELIASKSWRGLRVASKDRFHLFRGLDEELSINSLISADAT